MLLIGSAATLAVHWQPWYPVRVLEEQPAPIQDVGYSPDGTILFLLTHVAVKDIETKDVGTGFGSEPFYEDRIALYDTRSFKAIGVVSGGYGHGWAWFSPGGSVIQLSSKRPKTHSNRRNTTSWEGAWNIKTGKMVEALGKQSPELWILSFSPDERFAIVMVPHKMSPVVVSMPGGEIALNSPDLLGAVFSHRSERLVIPSTDGAHVYETGTWKLISTLGNGRNCTGVQFSPDDRRLSVSFPMKDSDWDETVVYDVESSAELFKFKGCVDGCTGISPDGRFIATFSPTFQTSIYEITSGRVIVKDAGPRFSIRYSPDGKKITSYFGAWNTATGESLRRPEEFETLVRQLVSIKAASADGRRVILRAEDYFLLANAETGETLFKFPTTAFPDDVHAAISPDSTQIVTAPDSKLADDYKRHHNSPHDPTTQATIWHRRRPECWWGLAWLPEFWLALLFAGALVWSIWRDRRLGSQTR